MMRLSGISLAALIMALPPAMAQQPATIDGWDRLKFGMTIDEAVKATPDIPWNNPERCKTPNPNIARAYCMLGTQFDKFTVTLAGVPFEPALDFDQHGQLVRIGLSATFEYSRAGTAQSCQDDSARIVAGLTTRFGPLQNAEGERNWTTDLAAHRAWEDARGKYFDALDSWKPTQPQIASPPTAPRPFVAFYGAFSATASSCLLSIDYVSAPLPRPIPRDTGNF